METLQTAEHVSEGNKSSSLLYKQIQSLLFRQKEIAALPQQQDNLSPQAASDKHSTLWEEEKVVISFSFHLSPLNPPSTARMENAGDSIHKPNDSKLSSTEKGKKQPSDRQLLKTMKIHVQFAAVSKIVVTCNSTKVHVAI